MVSPRRARDAPHPQPLPAHGPRIGHRPQAGIEGHVQQPVEADPGGPARQRQAHLHPVARPAARRRHRPVDAQAARDDPDERGDQNRQGHQADAEDRERRGAEPPAGHQRGHPGGGEGDGAGRRPLHPAHSGTGTVASASSTTSSARVPRARASGVRMRRCDSDGRGQRAHVVGQRVPAAREHGPRLGRAQQRQAGARAGAELDARVAAGGGDQRHHVLREDRLRVDPGRPPPRAATDAVLVGDRGHPLDGIVARPGRAASSASSLGGRVADRHAHGEAVELGLGQREGALVLHRVLGGDDHERQRQEAGLAVDRDLAPPPCTPGAPTGSSATRG